MNQQEFATYKNLFVQPLREILVAEGSYALDEAAFPAYANKNPLMSYLFWQRIRSVMAHLSQAPKCEAVLDFGCGSGVMLPFLSRISKQVVGLDTDLSPLNKMKAYLPLPKNVCAYELGKKNLSDFAPASFDVILALDVLEHVDHLSDILSDVAKLLTPNGQLIVSGPTENLAYRIGRKLAGPEYSGHYHVRNIYDIKDQLARFFQVSTIATLFYPVPLFKLYCATLKKPV